MLKTPFPPQPHVPASRRRGPVSLLVFPGCGYGRGRPRAWRCAGPAGAKAGGGEHAWARGYVCRCEFRRFFVRHTHTTSNSSGSLLPACVSSGPSKSYLPKTHTSILLQMYIHHTMTISTTTPFSMSAPRSRTALRPRARVPRQSRTRRSR
ncbi:hypothetical protein C8J57DRAFT_1270765 [Mycena rebaudengoi]|nr:hypothetical protein C8J57DRAFT_1270765 [Mycena rebaudengoi]